MGGLLYKDFLAVKGKKMAIIIFALTLVFLVLRLALPGADSDMTQQMGGALYDFFLWTFPACFVIYSAFIPSVFTKLLWI